MLRFDQVERAAHWLTALMVIALIATGAILYVPAFSSAVGHRLFVEDLHVWVGVTCFVPLVLGLAGPWGRRLRRDLGSMNRFSRGEMAWLRSLGRRGREAVGKFNPGQKLNAFVVLAVLVVQLGTGVILRWGNFVGITVSTRTGATFVHDWFALALIVLFLGHLGMAFAHPPALRSMVVGWVPRAWASKHSPAWQVAPEDGVVGRGT